MVTATCTADFFSFFFFFCFCFDEYSVPRFDLFACSLQSGEVK